MTRKLLAALLALLLALLASSPVEAGRNRDRSEHRDDHHDDHDDDHDHDEDEDADEDDDEDDDDDDEEDEPALQYLGSTAQILTAVQLIDVAYTPVIVVNAFDQLRIHSQITGQTAPRVFMEVEFNTPANPDYRRYWSSFGQSFALNLNRVHDGFCWRAKFQEMAADGTLAPAINGPEFCVDIVPQGTGY